jgi:hypothetical protein
MSFCHLVQLHYRIEVLVTYGLGEGNSTLPVSNVAVLVPWWASSLCTCSANEPTATKSQYSQATCRPLVLCCSRCRRCIPRFLLTNPQKAHKKVRLRSASQYFSARQLATHAVRQCVGANCDVQQCYCCRDRKRYAGCALLLCVSEVALDVPLKTHRAHM